MIRKILLAVGALVALLVIGVGGAYFMNAAPVVPTIPTEVAAATTKPFVVKLHARYCHICMATMGMWSEVERTYGDRVNLVVFDFTNDANWEASRAEAIRLGMEPFFNEYAGISGVVAVLDPKTKEVTGWIDGSRDFDEYRTAIDDAIQESNSRSPTTF